MRSFFAVLVLLCFASASVAADFNPYQGPKPIAVFFEMNPWAMVIGSDTPRVAIYENGDVVFRKSVGERTEYHHVTLDDKALESVREKLRPMLALKDVKPQYDVRPNFTDQPEAVISVREGERMALTSVYGLVDSQAGWSKSANTTIPPDAVLALHRWLCDLDFPDSTAWTPRYIEVVLWDFSHARKVSMHWPAQWPSLNSDRAVKRGEAYSIYLDGSMLPELRQLFAAAEPGGALEIDGRKMAVQYRYTFPGIRSMRAIAE